VATWQYVLLLVFMFGIGCEIAELNLLLRRILRELQNQNKHHNPVVS
jgi:hypothetical protein